MLVQEYKIERRDGYGSGWFSKVVASLKHPEKVRGFLNVHERRAIYRFVEEIARFRARRLLGNCYGERLVHHFG